jgi:hypothetical protein
MCIILPIIVTFTLILSSFLSGNIIDIPHGTQEGGIISVIGYFIILSVLMAIIFIISLLYRKFNMTDTYNE